MTDALEAPTPLSAALRPLLERRLVIITGKGGTGKTTVAAALGLAAANAGRRVLVAEMGRREEIPALLSETGAAPEADAGGMRRLSPRLATLRIDPFVALAEYLGLQLGGRALVDRVLRTQAFRQLMEASPGWRELITLGKLWHLEQSTDDAGQSLFDLIVVDAPATGHGLTFLDVPRVVVAAVRTGPLRRHSAWVAELIRDPERTLLLPIALAEELPCRETTELVERLRGDLGVAVDRVVVNALHPPPFPPQLMTLPESLSALAASEPDLDLGRLPRAGELAECAVRLTARYRLQQRWLLEIRRATGLPSVDLPFEPMGLQTPRALASLTRALLGPASSAAA